MTLNLGLITQLGSPSFFLLNNPSVVTSMRAFTALSQDDGWVPNISQYGSNIYAQRGLYDPIEETIKFQIYASGNDGPSKIHTAIQRLNYILDRAKQAVKYPENNFPLLYYTVSGASSLVPDDFGASANTWVSLIYRGELVLPKNYMRIAYLKKAIDLELKVLRDGLWINARAYQNMAVYSGIRNQSLDSSTSFSFPAANFANRVLTGVSDTANGIDTVIGPFPSISNNYYMPNGYIIYRNGQAEHGYCATTGSVFSVGVRDSSISDQSLVIGSTTYNFVRHNPTTTGWVTFMPNGRHQDSMELIGATGEIYDADYDAKLTHTHHIFGEFTTSGTASFSLQPMLQSYSGPDTAFYGQETVLTGLSYPEYVYLGVINTTSERTPMVMNYRTRRISGSGTLQVKEFHVFSTDKINITKLNANPTYSGVLNPYTSPIKPSGWLVSMHNYANTIVAPTTSVPPVRYSSAMNGPNIRLITEDDVAFESNVADLNDLGTFINTNFAYPINSVGNYGSLVEPKSFFGSMRYGIQTVALNFYVTLLWSQGSNRNSWKFMYPSGVFAPSVYTFLTPYHNTIPRV